MAITRRQFVTRLGALAAAAGFSQAQASQIMEALAYPANDAAPYYGTFGKPRVVWIHGAECTGCSTSLLGIFENASGVIPSVGITPAAALIAAAAIPFTGEGAANPTPTNFLLHSPTPNAPAATGLSPDPQGSMDIADVVIDVIDLIYHETVMGMGGDLAYQWLKDFKANNTEPFVLVVEGALQDMTGAGAWDDKSAASKAVPWCSIGMDGGIGGTGEMDMPETVKVLAEQDHCVAIVAIGQCATYGGYPGCKPPITTATAHFDTSQSQTGALGTYDYLKAHSTAGVYGKVVNVPGCPTNPWWFVLTVVCLLVDLKSLLVDSVSPGPLGILKSITPITGNMGVGIITGAGSKVDASGRLTYVYQNSIHGPYCSRYSSYVKGIYAAHPGDAGCLQKIGCKGPAAKSLCGVHGWNNQQPANLESYDYGTAHAQHTGSTATGGHCTRAGAPCMACTEKGYPDNFVPFVVR